MVSIYLYEGTMGILTAASDSSGLNASMMINKIAHFDNTSSQSQMISFPSFQIENT